MTSFAIPAPVAPVHLATTDDPRGAQAVAPDLGTRAVTATPTGTPTRNDPGRDDGPPKLPAPLKGLGIPPLNTRQVGDFDKLDDPAPATGWPGDALTEIGPPTPGTVDLRR